MQKKKGKNLNELSFDEVKKFYKNLDKKILQIFEVKNSMNSKKSYGGTSSKNVKNMIKRYKKDL